MNKIITSFTAYREWLKSLASVMLIALSFSLPTYAQLSYSLSFSASDFSFLPEKDGSYLIISKNPNYYNGEEGEMCMPRQWLNYAVPYGYRVKSATVILGDKQLMKENIILAPNPIAPTTGTYVLQTPSDPADKSDSLFSRINQFLYNSSHWGLPYGVVSVSPFVYDSETHDLYFASNIRLRLDLEENPSPAQLPINITQRVEELQRQVDNPEDVPAIFRQLTVSQSLQDTPYSELFSDGKEWKWCHYAAQPSGGQTYYTTHYIVDVKVEGSAIIDGIECKRLSISTKATGGSCWACESWLDREYINNYNHFENNDHYDFTLGIPEEVYVYEKARRIYVYRNPGIILNPKGDDVIACEPYFDLLVDLNVSVGDKLAGLGTIQYDDLIYLDGQPHRRLAHKLPEDSTILPPTWIEGIGLTSGLPLINPFFFYYGIFSTGMSSPDYALVEVKENNTTIFEQKAMLKDLGLHILDEDVSVETWEADTESLSSCYDLQGRPILGQPRRQLFIQKGKIHFNR